MKSGDSVALRSPKEILATLDDSGRLEGVPFMPEMLGYFGRYFTVDVRVERACDTVKYHGVRRLSNTVILDDLRCDGSGHDGCQAQCRIYWKEAWLQLAGDTERKAVSTADEDYRRLAELAAANTRQAEPSDESIYQCQATELIRAGEQVPWWSVRSLVGELTSGNVGPVRWVRVMGRIVIEEIARRLGLLTNSPFKPEALGQKSYVSPAPCQLQPGDLVQIKSRAEIGPTLGKNGRNRGLWFDREMVPYCGHRARVKSKVERFIDEGSGRMIELATDAYILDGVVCMSDRSEGRWFCPRAIYPWWREAWLEPVGGTLRDAQASKTTNQPV